MHSAVNLAVLLVIFIEKFTVRTTNLKMHDIDAILSRQVRTPAHVPHQSGISLGAAVAVPLDNGLFNVFMSYCIAGGFGQLEYDSPDGIDPPPFQTIYEAADESRKRKTRNALLTRQKFYRIIENNLKQYGFNGHQCLLKAICEAAQYQFGDVNGVLGDIVHILFLPTTSKDENLPLKYYEAEMNGQRNLCSKKYKKCPISIFDLITIVK